ncbi:MAG: hypothetical protein ABSG96_05640 [Terracidiphilus sp.]
MAGIAALLDQQSNGAQGNLNQGLYLTAFVNQAGFHDVTVSSSGVTNCDVNTPSMCNNSIPDPTGTTGGQPGFTPSASTVMTSQSLTVTVSASATGGAPAPTGTVTLGSDNYYGSATLTGSSVSFQIAAGMLAPGTDPLSVVFTPDVKSAVLYSGSYVTGSVSVTGVAALTPAVSVTPAYSVVALAEPLNVTVAVSGGKGSPVPSGSVTLIDGTYSSSPAALVGGSAAITIPAESLGGNTGLLVGLYAPDTTSSATYNNASGSATLSVYNPAMSVPIMTFFPSSTAITTAQPLIVLVAVSSNGGFPRTTGTVTLTGGGYTSAAVALNGNGASFNIPAGSLALGTDQMTASYIPDAQSSAIFSSTSGTFSVTVTPPVPPSFTVAGSAVSILPGAATGDASTITIAPSNGFTGSVTLTASVTSSPNGALYPPTLSFGSTSPVNITGTNAETAALTITTTAATTSSALFHPRRPCASWYAASGAALAGLLLLGIPARRRSWRTLLGMFLFLIALTAGVAACGGGGNGTGGGGGGIAGTTSGTYTITVTGTSSSTTETGTVTLTVQ